MLSRTSERRKRDETLAPVFDALGVPIKYGWKLGKNRTSLYRCPRGPGPDKRAFNQDAPVGPHSLKMVRLQKLKATRDALPSRSDPLPAVRCLTRYSANRTTISL